MIGRAWFSDCGTYRYALLRVIESDLLTPDAHRDHCVNFIMLNPSTATAAEDDPTIRRCTGYARRWGYGELMVTNLFGFRATDPRALKTAPDPIGPKNDEYIRTIARNAQLIVAAWGVHGEYRGRGADVLRVLTVAGRNVHILALAEKGQPKHPLYLRSDLLPLVYRRHERQAASERGAS